MNNESLYLIIVIAAAFIVGYAVVSFIIKKLKTEQQNPLPKDGHPGRSKDEESNFNRTN